MSAMLMDHYDAALFDLDGVVYLGPVAVPGAVEGLAALREHGTRIGFVTNNAARSPEQVVAHLTELGIEAIGTDVVVSSQAAARLVADRVPAGSPVLVVGTAALADQVRAVGLRVAGEQEKPSAVIQGYHPELPWELINRACYAIQDGALWFGTNTDSTRPTDLGLVPGAGAQIAAVRFAVGIDPLVAGKPFSPLLEETVARLGAARPIFVGDRIDTDIDGAANVGMDSLFVFSGAHGKRDVVAAANRPTHLGLDLRALTQPAAATIVGNGGATSGDSRVRQDGAGWTIEAPRDPEGQLSALRALTALVPAGSDPTESGLAEALDSLDLLP